MNGRDKESKSVDRIISVSSTMAGISIAVATIILIIFYQLRSIGEIDVAGLWLNIMRWTVFSFFLFASCSISGILYLRFSNGWWSAYLLKIVWAFFIIGWSFLFIVVYRIWQGFEFAKEIIGS